MICFFLRTLCLGAPDRRHSHDTILCDAEDQGFRSKRFEDFLALDASRSVMADARFKQLAGRLICLT